MLDLQQTKDAHIDQRLRKELIIWLSSVKANGRPHLVPVWFLWDGQTILIFSQPSNQKMRNLKHNPHVMLALEALNGGEDIVMIEGDATIEQSAPDQQTLADYNAKYGEEMQAMNTDLEKMRKDYSEVIRIRPTKFISW